MQIQKQHKAAFTKVVEFSSIANAFEQVTAFLDQELTSPFWYAELLLLVDMSAYEICGDPLHYFGEIIAVMNSVAQLIPKIDICIPQGSLSTGTAFY